MFNSKYSSSKASIWHPPSSSRFGPCKGKITPGPGDYEPTTNMNKDGKYFTKFESSRARTFYHSDRQTLTARSSAQETPGPGNYRAPSEFGYYDSKHKAKMSKTSKDFFSRKGSHQPKGVKRQRMGNRR